MSEAILKALMQLFALIGDIHDDTVITAREKDIVRIFLLRHLNSELLEKYMRMFEEYLAIYNSERIVKGSLRDRKRISLNAMRILALCERINEELHQKQKVYVLVKLTDYLSRGAEVTETELDFLQTVSNAFNIPSREFLNIRSFIIDSFAGECEKDKVLIIDNNKNNEYDGIRHVCKENLKGIIRFLYISITNTWIMKYSGNEDIYLNGQNLKEDETYIFDHGSSIRGSGIKAIYYSEVIRYLSAASYSSSIVINATDVSFRFRNSENGVHNLNFSGRSGELAGILGGSGVGKSTTLSLLSGTLKPGKGKILINGYDLYDDEERRNLTGVIGFVPQDDLLIEELTVYQNLYYNARMCLSNLSEEKLEEAVEKVLADFDLTDARDLKVGNPLAKVISGGQRKRINIALELMREPTILFVDEPTSGLSSVDSEMVMSLLKDLTYKGKLVIVNIHQPSSEIYKMFDKIMIIDRGGYQIFFGNPTAAIIYFKVQTSHANPDEDQCSRCGNVETEQILQIIEAKVLDEHGKATRTRKITPQEWAKRFREFSSFHIAKDHGHKIPLPGNSYSIPGIFSQSVIFFIRDFLSKIADKQYLIISLLGPPVLALLLAWFTKTPSEDYVLYENVNLPAFIFMCVITSMFFGLMGSSEEIVSDRRILKRESFLNLSWFSYLNSKVIILFFLSAIQTLSFVLIGNFILEIKGMTLSYWLVLFTTSCFGNILGLNLSSAFRSVLTIYILIPFIIIPQLLFSGVLVKFDTLNINQHEFVPVIGDLMIARWSFEAIATRQFRNNEYEKMLFDYNVLESENSWYALLADELKNKMWQCRHYKDDPDYKDIVAGNFNKIVSHTSELSGLSGIEFPQQLRDSLNIEKFNPLVEKEMTVLLDTMKDLFISRLKQATASKDSIEKSYERDWLADLSLRNRNEQLTTLVLAQDVIDKTYETNDKIIRKYEPGYMKAVSRNGRAHFYAPSKKIGNIEINTYWFNVIVVWVISFILYTALYLKLPGKLLLFFENLKLKRPE